VKIELKSELLTPTHSDKYIIDPSATKTWDYFTCFSYSSVRKKQHILQNKAVRI